jgi:antitoxin ChpS
MFYNDERTTTNEQRRPNNVTSYPTGFFVADWCRYKFYTGGDMKGTVKKWGDRPAVRIPAALLEAAHVDLEQVVEVREVIIEPAQFRPRYTLEELVAQCNLRKRRSREEQEWLDAPPVGSEAL